MDSCIYWLYVFVPVKEDLKATTDDASFVSFGRLFHARMVEGKKDSRKRLELAPEFVCLFVQQMSKISFILDTCHDARY